MPIVKYDTDDAVFSFPYELVIETIKNSIISNNVDDDINLLVELQQRSVCGVREITISEQDEGDYISRIIYIMDDLLNNGKGSVYCKLCRQEYSTTNPTELTINRITPFTRSNNADHTVFSRVIRSIKRCFDFKKPIYMPASGGTTVTCKNGHELLRTIEWMT